MNSAELETTSREIARWSEPLVADRIFGVYGRWFHGEARTSMALGRQHCRMWRNLLDGETTRAKEARRDLLELARLVGLEEKTLATIDVAIFEELFLVILSRCRGSRDDARINGMALLMAASALGEIRQAAARGIGASANA